MRQPLLRLVLMLSNAIFLGGALDVQAQQTTPLPDPTANAPQPSPTDAANPAPQPNADANEARKLKRFVSMLMEREGRAIKAQRQSLRELGRLEARLENLTDRLEESPESSRLADLVEVTQKSISFVTSVIQRRGARIADILDRELVLVQRLQEIAPPGSGFRLIQQLINNQIRAVRQTEQLQARLGVEPLPPSGIPTTDFPPGKPPASPVQA